LRRHLPIAELVFSVATCRLRVPDNVVSFDSDNSVLTTRVFGADACIARPAMHLLARLSRVDVLVIDDWAIAPLSEPERRDFWEICEDRYQVHSLILTSQLPVTRWHEQIGDPTVADGILDRRVSQCPPN
jgi:hypothetical protein